MAPHAPGAYHVVLERYPLGIVLIEPILGSVFGRENLEMLDVTDLLGGVHVDENLLIVFTLWRAKGGKSAPTAGVIAGIGRGRSASSAASRQSRNSV